jgi:hypothetical protein
VHRRSDDGGDAPVCQDPVDPDRTIGANPTDHGVTSDLLIERSLPVRNR